MKAKTAVAETNRRNSTETLTLDQGTERKGKPDGDDYELMSSSKEHLLMAALAWTLSLYRLTISSSADFTYHAILQTSLAPWFPPVTVAQLPGLNTLGISLAPYSPAAITGYLSSIESLSGTNFRKWKEQISIILGVMDLDYALRVDAPAALTAESSTEQKAAYEKWERSNRISLMIMKGSITTAIRGAIPDSDNAKLYLAHIEEQFQGSSKARATTLITKMVS
ncbi:hypothetical protein RJ639_022566 [Escallonia herrerae]|uniref:UBN2_3 domain-containing protein n=1 Tax=Escallonia herrerae TaxID=1293975 RepID=A0AA88V5N5_9ASTE|nr:hypothetical protein RJ639_022566 [Escallonia herrerae]